MFASTLRALAIMDSVISAVARLGTTSPSRHPSYFDVAFNMTDEMFSGIYFGKARHPPDLNCVLNRASQANVTHMLAIPGSLQMLKETLEIAKEHPHIFVSAGVHPTRCNEFEAGGSSADQYIAELKELIQSHGSKVVAVGECGLDYARTQFCDKDVQMKYFLRQLQASAPFTNVPLVYQAEMTQLSKLAKEVGLPLYLHSRDTMGDFCRVMASVGRGMGGIVHSFDGSAEEAAELIELGFYIGVNGCSLRTDQNIEVIKTIPLDRIVAETDAPWCGIKATHSSFKYVHTRQPVVKAEKYAPGEVAMVKDRNEPCSVVQVVEAIAGIKGMRIHEVADQVYLNAFSALRLKMPQ